MTAATTSSKTVLIAGDTAAVRERFATALEGAGHRALAARSAAELLARVRADLHRIDLLVLDLRLSQLSGVELIRTIRRFDQGRLPIVVFAGSIASASEVRQLDALGIAGYVNEHSLLPHIMPVLAPHLFPNSFNRRSSPRLVLSLPITIRTGSTIATAVILNLGKGGLAIRTMNPLDQTSKLRVRFRLPGCPRELEAAARVAWVDRRVGMGVQFEYVESADQAILDEFIDRQTTDSRS